MPRISYLLAALLVALLAIQDVTATAKKKITFDVAKSSINYAFMLNLGMKGSPFLSEVASSFKSVVGRPDLKRAVRAHLESAGQPEMKTGYIGSSVRAAVAGLCKTLDKNVMSVIPWAIVQPGSNVTLTSSYTLMHLWFKAVSPSCLFGVEAADVTVPVQFVAITIDGMIIWSECPEGSKMCHFFASFTISPEEALTARRSMLEEDHSRSLLAVNESTSCSLCTSQLVNCGAQLLDAALKCTLDALNVTQHKCNLDLCGTIVDQFGTTINCVDCVSYKATGLSAGGLVIATLDNLVNTVIVEAPKWIKTGLDFFWGLFA